MLRLTPARLIRRLLRLLDRVVRDAVREAVRAELSAVGEGRAPSPGQLLTLAEVATALGVSKRTVERIVRRGELGTVQAGSARRVHPAALDAYLRSMARSGTPGGSTRRRAPAGTSARKR